MGHGGEPGILGSDEVLVGNCHSIVPGGNENRCDLNGEVLVDFETSSDRAQGIATIRSRANSAA